MTPLSIGVQESPKEYAPKSSPPWVWLGFMFVLAFVVLETLMVTLELEEKPILGGLTLIGIGGFIYWLVCVHRLHKILVEVAPGGRYPITGAEAVGKHFIPFYNLYWVFKWPAVMSEYLNSRGRVRMMPGYLIGLIIFIALLVRYFFDTGAGLLLLFAITAYVSSRVKQHVQSLKTVSPEDLPPLPDPSMFRAQAQSDIDTTDSSF